MSDLKNKISELADQFSEGVLAAIRTVSLDELVDGDDSPAPAAARRGRPPGPAKVKAKAASTGRLARRSPEEIEGTISTIVAALKKAPDGMRSEQLQTELGLSKKEITGPLVQGLASKALKKQGRLRATTYFIGGAGGSAKKTKSPKKALAKTGKAKAKKASPKKKPAKKAAAAETKAAE